jgi:hypothetical protein
MLLAPTLLLNAGSGAAIARPTFSRDFAGEKTLNNGTGPAITFTRASNATFFGANGTLQTAAANVPRFDHDPATGASRGLLIEEARTNLLIRSAEFTDASWAQTNVTASDGQAAPDGTTNADGIFETVTNNIHETRQSVSIAATATHTYSVFLKANGRNFVTVYVRETANSGATYVSVVVDLSDGSISGSPVGTATVTSVGNGWYRVAVSASIDAGTRFAQIRLREDASTSSYAGDITKGVLAWGAQLEVGAFPTSYIPTTSAAATRSADSAVVTPISSFYNQAEGTLFAETSFLATAGWALVADDNTTSNRHLLAYSGNIPSYTTLVGAASQASISIGLAASAGDIIRHIGSYKENDFQAARNGTLGTADTSGTTPAGLSHLRIGTRTGSSDRFNGHIRKIAYWPRRLSNTLLQQLTT